MNSSSFRKYFDHFLPNGTSAYCFGLWEKHNFTFKIKPPRQTKLGDYKFDRRSRQHTITINNDLNPYSFLVTYLHEVAHLVVQENYGSKVQPHGEEWKSTFKNLMLPIFKLKVLPYEVQEGLMKYFKNPKASSYADSSLMMLLGQYDQQKDDLVYLKTLQQGDQFRLNNRVFVKGEKKRTRSLCTEKSTGRRFMVLEMARVEPYY